MGTKSEKILAQIEQDFRESFFEEHDDVEEVRCLFAELNGIDKKKVDVKRVNKGDECCYNVVCHLGDVSTMTLTIKDGD